jgi:hypothetical protein
MGVLSRDTTRAAEQAQIEVLRAMPAWKKLQLVADACEANRALMLAGLRSRNPSASEEELQRLLMGLLWGEVQATMIWGPPAPHRQ